MDLSHILGELDGNTGVTLYPLLETVAHVRKRNSKNIKESLARSTNIFRARFGEIYKECSQRVLAGKLRCWLTETSLVLDVLPYPCYWPGNVTTAGIKKQSGLL